MTLSPNRNDLEKNKFVEDASGDVALRIINVGSENSPVASSTTGVSITTASTVVIQKLNVASRAGTFVVYNSGSQGVTFAVYGATATTPDDYLTGNYLKEYGELGTQLVASGASKVISWENKYTYVVLVGSTATSTATVDADAYAY